MDDDIKAALDAKFNVTEITVRAIHELAEMEDLTMIEASLKYAADNEIDPEIIGTIIGQDPLTRTMIEDEARALNCLKKQPKTTRIVLD